MLDLPPHGEGEQKNPINNKDGPKNGNISCLNPGCDKCNENGSGGTVPEFKFRQSPDKGSKLLILLCGQSTRTSRLKLVILFKRRVKFRCEEGEEQVQKINAERVADNIPSLS